MCYFGVEMVNNFVEDYDNLPDEELVQSVKNGNDGLLHIIIERYSSVIDYYCSKYCPAADREDASQEAVFALYDAVMSYDSEKSSFSAFASLCIKRSVISGLRKSLRKKNIPDKLLSSIDDVDVTDFNNPEKIFLDKESYSCLTDTIKLELSKLELNVLKLYLMGLSYSDISEKMNVSVKTVDNSLKRVRIKLKNKGL